MEAIETDSVRVGELEIRPREGLVLASGRALTLSVREFDLLVALARHAGQIVSREELYRLAWGGTLRGGDRSCDVYVHKLRAKLDRALPDRRFIHTHVGFGYRLEPGSSHPFHTATTTR
ncbi:MAG: response regulator transcription factor [Actinomycetota bacterium]|nr:response regulator transcription factor [Actinomycetota bacterium]